MIRAARGLVPDLDHQAYREGVAAMTPLGLAIAVWGLVTGVAMVNTGLSLAACLVMTFTVFAGAAQLAVLPLLATGAPLPVVWATATLVNLRFVIFSAACRRYFLRLRTGQRTFAAYLNGDLGFALFSQRFADAADHGTGEQFGYFYGTAAVNWVAWQAGSIAGFLLGGLAPTEWGLELAASLALIAVVVPMLREAPAVVGVAVTSVAAVATVDWPMRLGLLVSVLLGVGVALAYETFRAGAGARAKTAATE